MAATSLSKFLPKIDKICDAPFFKKLIKTSKKDAVIFINENKFFHDFLQNKEDEINRFYKLVREDIVKFASTKEMKLAVISFKTCNKEKIARDKADRKELEKKAIIEEYLREQERSKEKEKDRKAFGLTQPEKLKVEVKPVNTSPISISTATNTSTAVANTQTRGNIVESEKREKNSNDNDESSEETILNLDDFFTMFQAVYDQGCIDIKLGNKSVKGTLEMNDDKIIIQIKQIPTISIKK